MGMESWYINIEAKKDIEFKALPVIFVDETKNGVQICISYSYLSFFEGAFETYRWICSNVDKIFLCETHKQIIDIENGFLVFFNQIYQQNESKINNFYDTYGFPIVKSGIDTFKAIRKYKKIIKHI